MARGKKKISEGSPNTVEEQPSSQQNSHPQPQSSPAPSKKIDLIITTRRQAAKAQEQGKADVVKIGETKIATRSGKNSKTKSKEKVRVRKKCVWELVTTFGRT